MGLFIAELRSFAEMEYIIFEKSYLANCGSRYCLVINIEKLQCSEQLANVSYYKFSVMCFYLVMLSYIFYSRLYDVILEGGYLSLHDMGVVFQKSSFSKLQYVLTSSFVSSEQKLSLPLQIQELHVEPENLCTADTLFDICFDAEVRSVLWFLKCTYICNIHNIFSYTS